MLNRRLQRHARGRSRRLGAFVSGSALVVAMLALLIVARGDLASAAHPGTTVFVDASNAGTEDGSASFPFNTIQEGVNHATASDTVEVAAGNYSSEPGGVVAVDKSLTLRGAQAGVDARGRSGAESIVGCIRVDPSAAVGLDVTIDGFTVTGGGCGIEVTGDLANAQRVSIQNNIVSGFTVGIDAEGVGGSAQLIVSQNVTFGNLDGIIIDDGNITGSALVMIENNSLTDDTCVGIWLNTSVLGAARVSITGNTVSGTTQTGCSSFEPAGMGVFVRDIGSGTDSPTVTISGNTISGSVDEGILIDGAPTSLRSGTLLITGNTIAGNGDDGISIDETISGSTVTVSNN